MVETTMWEDSQKNEPSTPQPSDQKSQRSMDWSKTFKLGG